MAKADTVDCSWISSRKFDFDGLLNFALVLIETFNIDYSYHY